MLTDYRLQLTWLLSLFGFSTALALLTAAAWLTVTALGHLFLASSLGALALMLSLVAVLSLMSLVVRIACAEISRHVSIK